MTTRDYYELELDDLVISLSNADATIGRLERKLDIATKALKRIFYERDERAVGDYLWIASNALKEMEET